MVILIAILAFLIIVASTWWFGLWSNFILLINFFLAALIASSFYETVTKFFPADYYLVADFVAIWLMFALAFMVLRGVTDLLSKMRLKFDFWTEMVGRSVLSVWLAGAFVCFLFFTLHLSPLPPDVFQATVQEKSFGGIGPDRAWLAFIQSRSRGALSESQNSGMLPPYLYPYQHPDDEESNLRVFDPGAEFIYHHLRRRAQIAANENLRANP